MKNYIFWDITPFNSVEINRHFGGAYRLHLQGVRDAKEALLAARLVVDSRLAYS
jgi:hypothetical protein